MAEKLFVSQEFLTKFTSENGVISVLNDIVESNGELTYDGEPINKDDFGTISEVGSTGRYADLLDKPFIPIKISDLSEDIYACKVSSLDKMLWSDKYSKAEVDATISSLVTTIQGISAKADLAFQSASDGKTTIANAISGMGIYALGSETFNQLATKISQLSLSDIDGGTPSSTYTSFVDGGEV